MERSYTRDIRSITSSITRATNKRIDFAKLRPGEPGYSKRLRAAITAIRRDVRNEWGADEINAVIEAQTIRVSAASDRAYVEALADATGLDRDALDDLGDFDPREVEDLEELGGDLPSENEAAIASLVRKGRGASTARQDRAFAKENRALLRDLSKSHTEKLATDLLSLGIAGVGIATLRAAVSRRNGEVKRRGDIVAADQSQKLNGAHARVRQGAAGVDSYTWRTQGDDRVRDEHVARDGLAFRWDSPPEDGHPGEPINCRCFAVPRIDTAVAAFSTGPEAEAFKELQGERQLREGV